MLACQLESEEKKEENEMVTIVVTVDQELLRMADASLRMEEEGLHSITGELQKKKRTRKINSKLCHDMLLYR